MKAYVTVGIPGCGKSTWAKEMGITDINLDTCRWVVSGDESNQSCTPKAVELRDKLILQSASKKDNIIISDTNANAHFRKQLIDKLRSLGYEVVLVVFAAPVEMCKVRNLKRERQVPEQAIDRIHKAIQDNPPLPQDADGFITLYPCGFCGAASENGNYCSAGCAEDSSYSYGEDTHWEPDESFYSLNDKELDQVKDHINKVF